MTAYDKELINSRIIEICDYYLPGEGRREGQNRQKWCCPVCGGDDFTASTQKQCAGCLSPGCEVPRTKDAVGIIAYFEELEQSGQGFVRCLKKGYEILAIPEPEEEGKRNKRSSKARSVKPEEPGSADAQSSPQQPSDSGAQDTASQPDTTSDPATAAEHQPAPPSRSSRADVGATDVSGGSLGLLHALHNGPSSGDSSLNGSAESATGKGQHSTDSLSPQQRREVVDQVYQAFLELCPLIDRDREFWSSRGVTEETMRKFGFGSLSRGRCHEVLPELERRFGREALVSVPGFYVSQQGNLHTNLYDDYTLIPYQDRDGYITMVQGRVPGQPEEGKPKYKAPVNSGLHLYVPPGYKPEQVMAVCEGAVGAIVAAQSGIPVAAITGYQCYRIAGGRGEADRPLPEHESTDFGGRKVLYLPDEDVKPKTKEAVQAEAPKAARALIEAHGGTPYIAQLPEGYADLDEWLLALDPDERIPKFAELMEGALTPEQWSGEEKKTDDRPTDEHKEDDQSEAGENEPEPGAEDSGQTTENAKSKSREVRRATERKDTDYSHADSSTRDDSGEDGETDEDESGEDTGEPASGPGLRTPDPGPRPYRPIPKTNIGEFMVSLIYGLAAGLGFMIVVMFAASEWGPPSLLSFLTLTLTIFVSVVIAAAVMIYMRRKLYWRRYHAIKNHLAGKK